MATQKTKTKSSKSGTGSGKRTTKGKSTAAPKRPASKAKAAPAAKAKPAAVLKTKPAPNAQAGSARNSKAAPPPAPSNGKGAAPAAGLKKKPPSITITRPEVTRPPVVLPPPRPLEAPIGAPSILLPKDGLATGTLTPILRWMYVGGATRYEVEWSSDPHFGRGRSASVVAQQTAITLDSTNQLKPSTNYKWRVRGGNEAGWGPWSHPESFRSPEK